MAKKIEINENWEPVEVEDLDNLFIVVFKHGSFDQGYVEAFDTDDILMQSAYDSLAKQYDDCGCDELTKIYLIKVPNTDQTQSMCNTGLFNGNCCDPHVIEATRDLFNRADCEHLSCWEGCGLTEAKKKKKPYSSAYCGFTDPELNIKHFNKCMGTGGLQNPDAPHLIVGDVLPNAPVASDGAGESAGGEASSGGEGGAIGESLNEAKEETLEDKIRSVIAHKETDDWHDGKAYLFEVSDESKNSNNGDIDPFWIEKFDDGDVDFSKLTVYERTPEEKEDGKCVATFMLSGGKNGSGNWTDYLDKLTKTFEELKEKTGTEPLLYKLDTDICDDVWTAYIFLYDHDTGVEESLLEAFEDIDFLNPQEPAADYEKREIEKQNKIAKKCSDFLKKFKADFCAAIKERFNGAVTTWEVNVSYFTNYITVSFCLFRDGQDNKVTEEDVQIAEEILHKLGAYKTILANKDKIIVYLKYPDIKESLNEDLIVIEPNEAKEKLTELQDQIKAEKDEKVRKSLLTLMNIYLFQTYKPSDRENSTLTDDEWQEIADWHKEETQDEKLDEELWPKKHELVDDRFEEKEVMKAKVKDWLAAEKPCEFQIEDVPADLTWEEVINAYKEGKEPRGGLHLDTEPREYIWQRAGELYYLQTGKFLDADFERIYKEKRTDLQTPEEKVEGEEMLMATKPGVPEDGEEVAVEEPIEDEELMEENLNEAHLDYSTQLAKMKALENRTRGFNAASASDEKLEYNWRLCKNENLPYAQSVMEQEMLRRGGRLADLVKKSQKRKVKLSDYTLELGEFILGSAKIVWAEKDNPQKLIDDYGNDLKDMLIILVFALWMKQVVLAGKIKDYIINTYTITLDELKTFLNKHFADKLFIAHVNKLVRECCAEDLVEDVDLDEASGYSHKLGDKFELPSQIKLLDQKQVEDFIKQLSPEELFRVGYATPLYFYSELDNKFDLVKATEMEGYTGMDYRDAVADQNVADHADRVANAQRQIDTYTNGASGHKLNTHGERFSTDYRETNKLALNPKKSNEYVEYELDDAGKEKIDAEGNKIVKSKVDMNKILFYPRVGSQPITHYYIDFHNGQGFKPIKREVLADTLYQFILELDKVAGAGYTAADLIWLQKKGYGDAKKDAQTAINAFYDKNGKDIPIWAYRKADEAGIPVEDYVKEHPQSPRWSMTDFRKKASTFFDADASTVISQDAATISGKDLTATKGMNRDVTNSEEKPQVRALYSNQVYFLDGKPGKLGAMLHEGLEEEIALDEAKDQQTLANLFISCLKRYYTKHGEIKDITDFANYLSGKFRIVKDLKKELSSDEFKNIILNLADRIKDNACYDYIISNIDKILTELKGLSRWDKDYSKKLDEAKRYVKRYYVRPQNIFCSNKEDILQALLRVGDENCSIYSLKNLPDHDDVHLLKPSDIIYYYDDHVLYDKNHVQVMDYDLFVKHEEDRKKVANVDAMSDAAFADEYEDRVTDDDLKDKEVIANFKAINAGDFKEEVENPFNEDFTDINVYGETLTEAKEEEKCCICGEPINGHGNNPVPYKEEGRCCDACNLKFVIPARLAAIGNKEDK